MSDWKPGDPCPSCNEYTVKFNGGNPFCIGCGTFVTTEPRLTLSAEWQGDYRD